MSGQNDRRGRAHGHGGVDDWTDDWTIVGGGLHGVHIAVRLLGEAGSDPARLRIIDPQSRLLERWRVSTASTGMKFLRSPSVHHLDLEPASLQHFAGGRRSRPKGLFAPPYNRPALDLFNAHCDDVLRRYGLPDLHFRDAVQHIALERNCATIRGASGATWRSGHVVLALGIGDQPQVPGWAQQAPQRRIRHLFAGQERICPESSWRDVLVVGGGISAVQVALRLVAPRRRVRIVARHEVREHMFDSDPGWLGPLNMTGFLREPCLERRRALILEARHRGSVPPDLHRALRRATARDAVEWIRGEIVGASHGPVKSIVELQDGRWLEADQVILATGFHGQRPGGRMVDELVREHGLACAACGFPVTDPSLRWHPRLFVTGALAELSLGPVARNIAGARRAGDRIVQAVKDQREGAFVPADRVAAAR